jgi:type IV pilus assembly protein PilQ
MLCAQAQAESQNSITALNVSSGGNGKTVIRVGLAQPLANLPAGFTINTPPRIAFDFPNTSNGLGKSVQDFNEGDLRSANIVQAGNRTRLVVNLNQMLTYDTRIDGSSVLITLQGKATGITATSEPSRFAEAKPGAQTHSLRDIDFRRGKNGEGRIQIDLSDSGIGIDIRQQGTTLIVDFLKTSLPRNLQRKLDVIDFATPVQGVDTFAQGDNVRMVIEPKGQWEHAAYQTDNKFIIEVKSVADDSSKISKGAQAGYAGEKLTLNFQKIDVREALNVIADFTELNMVISDTVSGNLTLRLKDVPWDQALDIILQSRDLGMRKNGNVIQVARHDELATKEKLNLAAQQEISELEELRTESFQLSYQSVAEMIALLTNPKQPVLSKRGSAVSDTRTGTLFIQDTPSRLEEVRNMIKKIDVPVRQVMIEARFVSAKDTLGKSLGAKISSAGPAAAAGGAGGFHLGAATPTATRGTITSAGSNVNLPASSIMALSLFNPANTKVLNLELAAAEADGTSKNIASPRVVTADRKKATVSQGTKILSSCITSAGATAPCYLDAVLSLDVTPQITPDDHINMVVIAKHDVPSGSNVDTKSVNTEVLIENGGTVVIGGVFSQDTTDDSDKVPVLGDVPVVGWLFKNRRNSETKSELLIFITPKIVQDALNLR